MSESPTWHERSGHLTLGVMVRTLGAFPSGWRMPGAHSDPADDTSALRRIALAAEAATFDYLYFGDWLSTGAELELTDPHLLVRTDPLSTAAYLAAVTERIGLVGTASVSHSEPYDTARTAASIDLLSGGRFGLNLLIGSDQRSAANFGSSTRPHDANRFDVAAEYIEVLRGLWGTVHPELFTRDAVTGALIDPTKIAALDHAGLTFQAAGPLNTLPPVQGEVPLALSGNAPRARALAAGNAELYLTTPSALGDAIKSYRELAMLTEAYGRARSDLKIVAPLLPIVASTREAAFELYDQLVSLVVVEGDGAEGGRGVNDRALAPGGERSAARITQLVGLALRERQLDETVSPGDVEHFNAAGRRLLDVDAQRSGRVVGTRRAPTYRHLLVAQLVNAPIVVGSPQDLADHIETWYRSSAVDGFTILSAFLHEQFESFAELVIPELRRRGLFRTHYEGETLRDHLGSAAPPAANDASHSAGSSGAGSSGANSSAAKGRRRS
ncbi:NtaA/DmoA family FMN-dependent monooxygenase [Subtercola lobariae]|uniref:Monooxygenase n=1 Tax=Subtercola lobariae TaxID=1588641 RepID=A0A917B412_9MICO|nr:NtaA/DmoA family FMN-dependent monooxygenase [Subtercola lobariae]GGF21877.1 monooxygenase [Subtercola lobariae]